MPSRSRTPNRSRIRMLRSTLLPALAAALLVSACASEEAAGPGPAAAAPAGSGAPVSDPLACANGGPSGSDIDGWPIAGGGSDSIRPMPVSSLLTVGPTRLLFSVSSSDHRSLVAEENRVDLELYALERDPGTPVASVEGAYLDTGLGRGLYRASIVFDCAGEWGAEVSLRDPDGSVATGRMRFQVHPEGTTPAIGEPAPRSESLTASTPEELALVSTDPDPYPAAYERSIAEVVSSGRPSLVLFATPAFCQTGHCGPMVEAVKSVAIDYHDRIGFVIVEPYELHVTENGLQPLLDDQGRLQPVQAVLDYGIPVEPYLFLVDAEGDVVAKFEGAVGADELRMAIEDVLPAPAA